MKSSHTKAAYRWLAVLAATLTVISSISFVSCSNLPLIEETGRQDDLPAILPITSQQDDTELPNPQDTVSTYINPLTGLTSLTSLSYVRPVSLSFDSRSSQYGLSEAQILIECAKDNGETALCGISNTYASLLQIGAIISSRPFLCELSSSFSAVCVMNGTSDLSAAAYQDTETLDAKNQGLSSLFYTNPTTPGGELFTSGTRLAGGMENYQKTGGTLPYLLESEGNTRTPREGTASGVILPYTDAQTVQLVYTKEAGGYQRKQNAVTTVSQNNGEPLLYKNVILMICESTVNNRKNGKETLLSFENGGSGYFISEGKYESITWTRESGTFAFFDSLGASLTVNRGKTYIGLIDIVKATSVLITE